MDVAQPPADAVETASGMHYKVVLPPKEETKPGRDDTVFVNFTAWRTSGETLGTEARSMLFSEMSAAWAEALQEMKIGEQRIYWIPARAAGRVPDQGTVVILFELSGREPPPTVPPDVAAPPADAVKTPSGLAYEVLQKGTGTETAQPWDELTVYYTYWSTDGRMVGRTLPRRPWTMQPFRHLWRGWSEAVQRMVQGEKIRVWVPESVREVLPGSPKGTMVWEIELAEIKKLPPPPPVPEDVAAPPEDARKTAAGVYYKVLKKGTGTEHPTAESTVNVHYTGWTTKGSLFDTTVVDNRPRQVPLQRATPGWTDGLQVMVVGETTRFWIPEELAYKGKQTKPQGVVVLDIELLDILDAPPPPHDAPQNHSEPEKLYSE